MREKEGIEKRIYGTDRDVFVSFADFSREWWLRRRLIEKVILGASIEKVIGRDKEEKNLKHAHTVHTP